MYPIIAGSQRRRRQGRCSRGFIHLRRALRLCYGPVSFSEPALWHDVDPLSSRLAHATALRLFLLCSVRSFNQWNKLSNRLCSVGKSLTWDFRGVATPCWPARRPCSQWNFTSGALPRLFPLPFASHPNASRVSTHSFRASSHLESHLVLRLSRPSRISPRDEIASR